MMGILMTVITSTLRGNSMDKQIAFIASLIIVIVGLYLIALFFIAEKSTGGLFLWVGYGCMMLAVLIIGAIDGIKTILQYRKFNRSIKVGDCITKKVT